MNVPCPHCGETLFHLGPVDDKGEVLGISTDDPRLDNDDEGKPFKVCPHCDKRVKMQEVPGGPSGISHRVHPEQ